MQLLSYVSTTCLAQDQRPEEVASLVRQSKRRNADSGITGVLFLKDTVFFQTIEGPNDAVRSLFNRIKNDTRHRDIYVLISEPVTERRFPNWSMEGFHDPETQQDLMSKLSHLGQYFCRTQTFNTAALCRYISLQVGELAPFRL